MSSTRVQSIEVAAETSYCMIAVATGQPSNGALAVNALEYTTVASLYEGQATPSTPREDARASPYALPSEPVTMLSGGTPVQRRQGSLTVGGPLRTIGAADTAPYGGYTTSGAASAAQATPFGALLSSCMARADAVTGSRTETISATAATTANTRYLMTGGAGAGSALNEGDLFKIDRTAGGGALQRVECAAVTSEIASGADTWVYLTPGMTTDPTTAEVVRRMCTWYPAIGLSGITDAGFVTAAAQIRMHGGRMAWLNGIVASKFRIFSNGGRVDWEATLDARIIQDADAGAPVNPARMEGAVAHALGAYAVIGSVIDRATGFPTEQGYAGTLMNLASFDLTFTPTLAFDSRSDDLAGAANVEITNWDAELVVTMTPHSTLYTNIRDMFLTQQERNVCIGFGPVGQGNGGCIWMGAAVPQGDALISEGENGRQVVTVTYKPGLWDYDAVGGVGATDTPLRIGLSY